jgi:hypothetical protein
MPLPPVPEMPLMDSPRPNRTLENVKGVYLDPFQRVAVVLEGDLLSIEYDCPDAVAQPTEEQVSSLNNPRGAI